MNVFMMEFFNPVGYYRNYYNHTHNQMNRPPEPVSDAQILQWKRQCEAEISKRGLSFHDIGHGWTAQPFGIDTALRVTPDKEKELTNRFTPEQRQYLALIGDDRPIFHGSPNWAQFCMSNPKARKIVADYVAAYAENHSNSDYIHVWLADGVNNHCECENCKKKSPSDWYVMLLNDIDDSLTAKNLNTRIVYIAYTETMWAPETEKFKNPDRFALLFAPISREYSYSLKCGEKDVKITPYVRNKNELPNNFDELFANFKNWTKGWSGANLAYEYHFWKNQLWDVGGILFSRVINRDIKFYKKNAINGVIEDGSQRSFFPSGLAFYTYARTLYDVSLSAEEIAEEYLSCAFGDDWKKFYDYLEKLGEAFGHDYLSGDRNRGTGRSEWYAPEQVEILKNIDKILEYGRKLIAENYNSDYRVRTVSARLLEFHAKYAEYFAKLLIEKAQGNDEAAKEIYTVMCAEIGKGELAFERWYDHCNTFNHINYRTSNVTQTGSNDAIASV